MSHGTLHCKTLRAEHNVTGTTIGSPGVLLLLLLVLLLPWQLPLPPCA
jgi:hypothetical protein